MFKSFNKYFTLDGDLECHVLESDYLTDVVNKMLDQKAHNFRICFIASMLILLHCTCTQKIPPVHQHNRVLRVY